MAALVMLLLLGIGSVQATTVQWLLTAAAGLNVTAPSSGTGYSAASQTQSGLTSIGYSSSWGWDNAACQRVKTTDGTRAIPQNFTSTIYVEYAITAAASYNLNVTTIDMYIAGGGTTSIYAQIKYSTDDFVTSTSLDDGATNLSQNATGPVINHKTFGSKNIAVASGATFRVRVYPKNTGSASTSKYLVNSNVNITFTVASACPPAAITSITAPSSSICASATQTLTANGVTGNNPIITWWTGTGGTGSNLGIGTTLPNVGPGTYYARVTADCGDPVETSITVNTTPGPSIDTQPIAASYAQYTSASALSVSASGGGLSYQWYSSTDNSNATSGDDVAVGTNSSSYTPPTTSLGTLYYYCLVNGTCSSLKSNAVAVEITVGTEPSIGLSSGSATQTVSAGSSIGSIVYGWGGTAVTASIAWSGSSVTTPTGINEVETPENKTLSIAGSPTIAGTYNYSIQSSDGALFSGSLLGAITVKLATPTPSDASSITNQGFTANWADVSGESGYTLNIYQGATLISTDNTLAANSTSKLITGLNPNTSYTYKVIANGNGGTVPSSNESAASSSVRTLSISKAITVFNITGQVSSSVNEGAHTILVYMPQGTALSSLTPSTITTSDYASVNPAVAVAQDFTSPIVYTVTAEDGINQQGYTVTVQNGTSLTDNFRSKATGNWSDASTWESSIDNTNWISATSSPSSSAVGVAVMGGYTVTINGVITIPATTIAAGSTLKATAQPTLGSTLVVNGTYEHNFNGGSLPLATWNIGSICKVTGVTSAGVSNTTQNFCNFTWDCPAQTVASLVLFGVQTISGNVTINTTNNTLNRLSSIPVADQTYVTIIQGNLTIGNGASLTSNGSSRGGYAQFDIGGDLVVNGTLNGNNNFASSYAIFNVGGNLNIGATGSLTKGATGSTTLKFTKAGAQTYTKTSSTVLPAWDIIVNSGSTLNVGNQVIDGTATFTLNSDATLQTSLAAGVNGNLTTSGTKTLNAAANYIFNGSVSQVPGALVTSAGSLTVSNTAGLTISANTTVSNLTIDPGAILNLSAAKQLTVSTTLSNSGTLNLLSDATGTGTLLSPASLSGTGGTYNVQQYLTGSTNSGTGLPNGRFWYVSSPVTGATSAVFAPSTGNKFWSWVEASNGYSAITTDDVPLTSGIGYVARMKDNTTLQFAGTIRTGDINIDITRSGSTNSYRGFNLIGNPYPSFATLAVADNTAIEPSIWYRTLTSDLSAMAFDTYNYEGASYVSGSNNGPVTGFIPPMQAFWVKTHIVGTSTVAFKQVNRSHQASVKLRSAEVDTLPCIRLQITNGKAKDQTLIGLYKLASDELDRFDSHKMKNGIDSFPEIFTMNGNEELAINGLKHDGRTKTLALGFRTGKKGDFKLKVLEMKNLGDSLRVILKDKIKNCEKELKDSSEYDFTSDVATTTDRFTIVITANAPTSLKDVNTASADAFSNSDNQIQVRLIGTADNNAKVSVYSTLGQQLGSFATSSANTVLSKRFAPGIYLVNVVAQGVQVTKKVVINQ